MQSALRPPKRQRNLKKRSPAEVAVAMAVFYIVLGLFGAKGLHRWATRLGDGEMSAMLRAVTHEHWRNAALLGLEQPAIGVERWFLSLQDAHKLMYPHTYAEDVARQRAHAKKSLGQNIGPTAMGMEPVPTELTDGRTRGPKVLVLGDSLMLTVGPVVKKDIEAKLGGFAWVKAKLGTGLSRPDVFDWAAEVRSVVGRAHFDAVVMMFGTNDSQDFYEEGTLLTYGTEAWVRAYNQRIAALMAATCAGAQRGIWIGMPPMRNPAFARKMLRVNAWAEQQVAAHPCMEYVPTDHIVGDQDGAFADYLNVDTRLEKVRMVDGIHVTAKGGALISGTLMNLLKAAPSFSMTH